MNKILKRKFPILIEQGFVFSPFVDHYLAGSYIYVLFRLIGNNIQSILFQIHYDTYDVQIYFNVFELANAPESQDVWLNAVRGKYEDFAFGAARLTHMSYFRATPPRWWNNYGRFSHNRVQFKPVYTPNGLERRKRQLSKKLDKIFNNIDKYFEIWHEYHKRPFVTDWDGKIFCNQPEGTKPIPDYFKKRFNEVCIYEPNPAYRQSDNQPNKNND